MNKENAGKRWLTVAAGCLILVFAGLIYAWSVISEPIAADFPQWTKSQLSLTFTLVMIFFCLGGLVAGLLGKKLTPQLRIRISAVMFIVGFFLTSRGSSLGSLYFFFGVLCGLASGFSYNAIMSSVTKLFPDKQGLVSGILLMGFGIGSFIIGKVIRAVTPAETGAWRSSFLVLGIAIFIVLMAGSFIIASGLKLVPEVAGKKADDAKKAAGSGAEGTAPSAGDGDVPPAQMLKTARYWIFYLWAILLSAAGLCVISQGSGIVREVSPALAVGSVATVAGLISIFNGVGRVVFGGMFDKKGRKFTMFTICGVMLAAGIITILALKGGSLVLLCLGFMLTGFAYGGAPLCCSAFISSSFGQKYFPVNYPLVNTNLVIASFGSTIAGALYDSTSSYVAVLGLVAGLSVVSALLCLALGASERR